MGTSLSLRLINCLTQSLLICGMSPVFGLFLIMATAAHGSAGSDSDIIRHYVALGRPAFIQLINGTSGYELTLRKDGIVILRFRKNNINFQENWGSQFNFDMNGTLMITKAERNLSGIYTLEIYDSDGKALRTETFHLIVKGAHAMEILFATLGTVVLLLILTVGVYSYCRKRPHVQAEESKPGTEEMTYAEVTFNKNKSRREKRAEPEVVYGEVRI
nr:uncharacterized protein LOC111854501 [Paramormyrops kingsleyae]XP_023688266.1 uncharacterized protein LOC111854501 [Paramormyrops kingsleyae]XP_023688267.1 uncharacterized protein LOC111854501 [Paramormyrops kingsleyae]